MDFSVTIANSHRVITTSTRRTHAPGFGSPTLTSWGNPDRVQAPTFRGVWIQ